MGFEEHDQKFAKHSSSMAKASKYLFEVPVCCHEI
jgi:hypothetical protein